MSTGFIKKFYKKLLDARWFYTFTASAMATIVGISLTFGLNSLRESNRKKSEAKLSIMQALDNIDDRIDQSHGWIQGLSSQDSIFQVVDEMYKSGVAIPDSTCMEFAGRIPLMQVYLCDHEFEKLFRESYQLWQILGHDELRDKMTGCYELLNYIEDTGKQIQKSNFEVMAECNKTSPLDIADYRKFTYDLVGNPQFTFQMTFNRGNIYILKHLENELEALYQEVATICRELGYDKYLAEKVHGDD